MELEKLSKTNQRELDVYCEVLMALFGMHSKRTNPESSAIKYLIRSAIRGATSCVTPFRNAEKFSAQYISEEAKKQLIATGHSQDLVLEHTIPVSVLSKEIYREHSGWDKKALKKFFLDYSITTILTKMEDQRLKDNKLRDTMPENAKWRTKPADKFARYHFVKIEFKERSPEDYSDQKKALKNRMEQTPD